MPFGVDSGGQNMADHQELLILVFCSHLLRDLPEEQISPLRISETELVVRIGVRFCHAAHLPTGRRRPRI